jgi:uncharacterized protein (TIRG00374 family)
VTERAAPPVRWKRVARRAVGPVIGIAIVVAIFAAVLPHIANYRDVWKYATNLSGSDWLVIGASIACNVATSGPPWMAAVPGLRYGRSMLLTQTSTLLTTVLPLGEAVGLATQLTMLRRWRFTPHAVTAGLVLVATWNQVVNILIPISAVVALGSGHTDPLLLIVSAIAALVMLAVVGGVVFALRSEDDAHRIGELAGALATRLWALIHREPRVGWGDRLVSMRRETIDVVSRRWHLLTLATLVNQLTLFGVMLACIHATGITGVSFFEALAAWSFARLIGSLAITPGGLGIQELGLTGALIGFGGGNARVVAATLLYRVLTFTPTVIVGSVCLVIWRRQEARARAGDELEPDSEGAGV